MRTPKIYTLHERKESFKNNFFEKIIDINFCFYYIQITEQTCMN